VPFEPDKRTWRPSVLPGQIVLISTVDAEGRLDLAPKSWITMVAFAGPIIAFGCNTNHQTYRNVLVTREFVVNIPGEPLVERVWALIQSQGAERIRRSGFTFQSAQKVRPPLVVECHAHLECELETIRRDDPEVLIFGKVVAASLDSAIVTGELADQYAALRPVFFLEDGVFGSIDTAKRISFRNEPVR